MAHELQQPTIHQHVEVSGDYLRSRSPLVLPSQRCVKCGSTEPGGKIHQEVVNYVNPLVWLTFLISGLITIIAYLFTRKPLQLQYYLCPKCEDKRRIARTTTSLVGFTSFFGLCLTIAGGPFEMFLGAFCIAILARIFWARSPLRAVVHDDGWFSIAGAAPKLLASLERKQLER